MNKLQSYAPPIAFVLCMFAAGVTAARIVVYANAGPRKGPAPKHDLATVKLSLPAEDALVYAVDGDTLHIVDGPRAGLSVRLTGFDAPETYQPHCPAEKALGERATARMKALLLDKDAALALQPGNCAYGRACGVLTVGEDKRDVGAIMIAEGLAARMLCPNGKCEPKKDWCQP
jgi:endonuclease YncB( thermonuclease family)